MMNFGEEYIDKNKPKIVEQLLTTFSNSKIESVRQLSADAVSQMIDEAVAYTKRKGQK